MSTIEYLTEPYELVDRPLAWQLAGRTWTATGYGAKIPSSHMVKIGARLYRVYVTCYSNAGTAWIQKDGRRLVLRGV